MGLVKELRPRSKYSTGGKVVVPGCASETVPVCRRGARRSQARKTPCERRFGESYRPTSPKDQAKIHQFGTNVLSAVFVSYELIAEGIWKGDTWIADLEELEILDASEIYARRLNVEEVFDITKR